MSASNTSSPSSPWALPPRPPSSNTRRRSNTSTSNTNSPYGSPLNNSPYDSPLNNSPYGMSPVQISSSIPGTSYQSSDTETIKKEERTPFSLRATSNVDCAVCQENFLDGESIRRLPCNHQFHTQCVDPWLALHARCPLCNSQMPGTVPVPAPRHVPLSSELQRARQQQYRRPPRERIGRRKKIRNQRNADLVSGAWLNNIVNGLSLEGISDDESKHKPAPAFFPLNNEEMESFVDDLAMPKSMVKHKRHVSHPVGYKAPKIDSRNETKAATFYRHWIKIEKKIRSELRRECKRNQGLYKFVFHFEKYVLLLSKERRHGKITVLPSCTDLDLLATMSVPPMLEGDAPMHPSISTTSSHPNQLPDTADDENEKGETKQRKNQKKTESKSKSKSKSGAILFHFHSGAQRLLAHGICQFHGLHCKSVTVNKKRVFRIHKIKKFSKRDNIYEATVSNDLILHMNNGNGIGNHEDVGYVLGDNKEWGVEEKYNANNDGNKTKNGDGGNDEDMFEMDL